jgi:hypothetical protein
MTRLFLLLGTIVCFFLFGWRSFVLGFRQGIEKQKRVKIMYCTRCGSWRNDEVFPVGGTCDYITNGKSCGGIWQELPFNLPVA